MSKIRYFVKRTLVTVVLIFLVISALFAFFRLMPGSFVNYLAAQGVGPEQLEAIKAKWGLNDPIYIQYLSFLENMLSGDVGESFRLGADVTDIVIPRILNSFVLVAPAITTAYIVGSIYGAILGTARGSKLEQYGVIVPTVVGTIPEFFLGILLILIFASTLNIFPSSGMVDVLNVGEYQAQWRIYLTRDFLMHYILPFMTIVLRYLYLPSLIMRTSIIEVAGQDFSYYHRIKGLSRRTRLGHMIKHASLPVITLFPVSMTRSIGGMVLVEVVFNWPGIGLLLVESVLYRDFPVVQFVFYLVAIWVILGNYVIDLLYSVIDPRISVE